MITAQEINARLDKAMKRTGKTKAQIAEEANTGVNTVNRGCYNRVIPNANTLEKLCRALDISADWVLGLLPESKMQLEEVCRAALNKYGWDAQRLMLFEEMAELQNAICKHSRGRDTVEYIAEEIADVEIMLTQAKMIYGVSRAVEIKRQEKAQRLRERMQDDTGTNEV